jgi:hypothetical protein
LPRSWIIEATKSFASAIFRLLPGDNRNASKCQATVFSGSCCRKQPLSICPHPPPALSECRMALIIALSFESRGPGKADVMPMDGIIGSR